MKRLLVTLLIAFLGGAAVLGVQWFLRFTFVIFCTALLGAVVNLGFTVGIPALGFRGQMKRFLVTLLFAFLGGFAGFIVPFVSLFALARVLSWWLGDPSAGDVFLVLMVSLAPFAVVTGIVLAVVRVNRWYAGKRKPDFDPGRRRFLAGMFGGEGKGK